MDLSKILYQGSILQIPVKELGFGCCLCNKLYGKVRNNIQNSRYQTTSGQVGQSSIWAEAQPVGSMNQKKNKIK